MKNKKQDYVESPVNETISDDRSIEDQLEIFADLIVEQVLKELQNEQSNQRRQT